METIAARDLILVNPDGEHRALPLCIGKPYEVSNLEWACPVQAEAIGIAAESIQGVDSFQALMLALDTIRQVMLNLSQEGFVFLNAEDNSPVDVVQLFQSGA
ncbi:DUF6968 family protein [Holophaga foetida]|uniref:DUF6968 family protein n=1 Tax=Holophaga foetida TaxID=35839 RepID=UPI0011DDF0FE|nr:hypothetical protein [Holophaga foetida]